MYIKKKLLLVEMVVHIIYTYRTFLSFSIKHFDAENLADIILIILQKWISNQ